MPQNLTKHPIGLVIFGCFVLFVLIGLAIWWRGHWLAYQIYAPADSSRPLPLVVILHGTGGDARTAQQWLGFDALVDEYGFIALYPHSPDGQWDAGAGILEAGTGKRVRRDDVGYIVRIIERVAQRHALDRERIFVAGISDGASMAFRLSCKLDGTFAALASVAATIPVYANRDCAAAKPLSALFIHGKQDTVLPSTGIDYRGIKVYISLEESVDWWLSRNGCDPQDGARRYQPFAGEVERWQVKSCRLDTEVSVFRVNDGGHSWPMRDHPKGRTSGPVNRDFDATAIIAEWFIKGPG